MPIRINLLAEAKALEDLRQRDPVKRVILVGVILLMLILAYSSSLVARTLVSRSEVSRLEDEIKSRESEYVGILQSQKDLVDHGLKLVALHKLSTNRFLIGNLLQTLTEPVSPDVQLTSLSVSHSYAQTPEVKSKPGERVTPKPATSKERIVLTLQARDNSDNPGDAVQIFKEKLSTNTYFSTLLRHTNEFRLVTLGAPQADPSGKPYLSFTLEARLPEKMR
ncbi:MAG TPA: hypothetical protein VEH04_03185 [Verrucomicrobiae bacterium]|nr:hypothetical protein [Verrucomicrobiae bacterium]